MGTAASAVAPNEARHKPMGVTVHFEGKLRDEAAFLRLVSRIEQVARQETLLTERFENQEMRLARVRQEKDWDYIGPTRGIILYLHQDCEPVRLEFDRDLYIQEWVKTQFAGSHTHMRLVTLLRDLQPFFEDLKVSDEGEYWETGDESLLTGHIVKCHEVIAQIARENPRAQVKVREADGRLTDLIS